MSATFLLALALSGSAAWSPQLRGPAVRRTLHARAVVAPKMMATPSSAELLDILVSTVPARVACVPRMSCRASAPPPAQTAIANLPPPRTQDLWDADEDGDDDSCMAGPDYELESLLDRLGKLEALPELDRIFNEILSEKDEACVTIKDMKELLRQRV